MASLLAGSIVAQQAPAFAQSAEPPPLILTPRTPSGGVYGADRPAAAPSAAPTVAPITVPAAPSSPPITPAVPPPPVGSTPTPIDAPASAPALPPPPPGALGTDVHPPATTEGESASAPDENAAPSEVQLREARSAVMRSRLRLLNSVLPGLAARSSSRRILDGVINMAIGGGVFGLGFAFPPVPGGQDMRPWFWTLGGVQFATGVVDLAWVPARERLSLQFEQMPMGTARERRLRVQFGEQALEDMAADGRRRRILTGVTESLVSVGTLAIIYREPIFNGTPYTFGMTDVLVLGLSGLSLVRSMLQIFQSSEEERLRDSYRAQVHVLRAERGLPDP